MENKSWTIKARLVLNVVLGVLGEKVNTMQPYVGARRALLAQREGLYISAMKALCDRLTDSERAECRKLMMEKLAHVRSDRRSLTSGAVL